MISQNIIQRVYHLRVNNEFTGTCFAIDIDKKQYIITAKHLLKNWDEKSKLQIFHELHWKNMETRLIGHANDPIDISVLAFDDLNHEGKIDNLEIKDGAGNFFYGQDVYFMGFPYGKKSEIGIENNNLPIPFVKKAIISNFGADNKNNIFTIFLDGINNPGFSGGPILYRAIESERKLFVAGVISGYQTVRNPVYVGDKESDLYQKENTGIIRAYNIKHVLEIITKNPKGKLC